MATATCPRCRQTVDSQAVNCPYCRTQLKAYGHPGIPLHRAAKGEYLCKSCTYEADDSCNFPQRPYATECTLYENLAKRQLERQAPSENNFSNWVKRNQALLLLLGLLLICFLITLAKR